MFIGTHCVAAQLFTTLLLPQLKAAVAEDLHMSRHGFARVIWTSSIAADDTPHNGIEFDRLDSGTNDRIRDYGVSKFGNWLLGCEFARRHGSDGIISVTLNPGNAKAGTSEGMPFLGLLVLKMIMHEPRLAAYTQLYAGLSKDITMEQNGAYILPWGRIRTASDGIRKDLLEALTSQNDGGLGYGEKFWNWCESQWRPFV